MDEERSPKKKRRHRDEGKMGKKDGSKRCRDEEAAEADSAACIRENGEEDAVVGAAEEKQGHMSKKHKGRRSKEEGEEEKRQAEKSGSMAVQPCLEAEERNTSKANVKKDKKRKKEERKERVAEAARQKRTFDTTACKEQAETSGLMVVKPCSECVEGYTSRGNVKKDSMKNGDKKKERESEMIRKKQPFDTTVEDLGADRVEGKQSSKSKKSKHKRDDVAEASVGDRVVAREDKRRKKEHSAVWEESGQTQNTSKAGNGEIKKRGKESNKASPSFSANASAGGEQADVFGNNDKKEGGIIKGEGKAAQSKNKGRRVSFAASVEVFGTEGGDGEEIKGGKKKKKIAQSKNKGKRVSFPDSAEVFSIGSGDGEEGDSSDEFKFVHGQRFTPEEDATLVEAMKDYTEMKQLGEKGLEMIRSSGKHPELKGCWDVIGKSLPHRPHNAIYRRAHILLYRSDQRKWTQEEKEYIRRFVEKNGTDWKTLAHELGKCDIHVKDTWRRIKHKNLKKGHWTQDEHQKLFDLVNLDLRLKAHQNKNPDHRKLRDNISWEAISEKLTTRNHKNCCLKWYDTLASPLVKNGIWADIDDYLLVEAEYFYELTRGDGERLHSRTQAHCIARLGCNARGSG